MSLSYKKEPKTEVKVVMLNKDSVFLAGILGSLNKVLCQCLKSRHHTCTQTFLECPPGVFQTLNGKFVSTVMCREPLITFKFDLIENVSYSNCFDHL